MEGDYSKETIFGVAHTIFFGSGALGSNRGPIRETNENSGIDEWKSLCNLPPAGGKLHLPHFTMNGRSRWLNLLKKVRLHSA